MLSASQRALGSPTTDTKVFQTVGGASASGVTAVAVDAVSVKYAVVSAAAANGTVRLCATSDPSQLSRKLGSGEKTSRIKARRDADRDERDQDEAEDGPAVAADDLARAAERLAGRAAFDHDHRHEHRPDREQEEPRDDEEDEADPDPDRREDAGDDQRGQPRSDGCVRLADRAVGASVAHVADELDERALHPEVADDADHDCDQAPEDAGGCAVARRLARERAEQVEYARRRRAPSGRTARGTACRDPTPR